MDFIIYIAIGMFIGWQVPRPEFVKKIWNWIISKFIKM